MTSPGFHSAAFPVHLSGLWVAMRRACRHVSFFCVSTQVVTLCVSIFSSASFGTAPPGSRRARSGTTATALPCCCCGTSSMPHEVPMLEQRKCFSFRHTGATVVTVDTEKNLASVQVLPISFGLKSRCRILCTTASPMNSILDWRHIVERRLHGNLHGSLGVHHGAAERIPHWWRPVPRPVLLREASWGPLHHHRMKYCCLGRLHHVCCRLLEYPRSFHRHECLFLQQLFYFCISFCLDDESEHSALGSAEHVFMFLCCNPCSGTVRYCRCASNAE